MSWMHACLCLDQYTGAFVCQGFFTLCVQSVCPLEIVWFRAHKLPCYLTWCKLQKGTVNSENEKETEENILCGPWALIVLPSLILGNGALLPHVQFSGTIV